MASWEELLSLRRPWVIAHRGFSARYPENTFASFEAAIDAGADALELDVTLTGDAVPVILHDERVDRTTDGEGLVSYMSADRIAELDAGSWFDPRFQNERIPTLERVFESLGNRIVMMLELRASAFAEEEEFPHLELEVVELVRRYGLEKSVLLSTFEPRFFARIERQANDIPRVLMCDQGPCEADALGTCQRLGAMGVAPDADLLDQVDVLRLRTAGYHVFPWTINDEDFMREVLGWGVDGIVTDRPDRLLPLVVEHARPDSMSAQA